MQDGPGRLPGPGPRGVKVDNFAENSYINIWIVPITYVYLIYQNRNKMTTGTNSFGEQWTKWQSHKHPENSNFMQVVYWHVFEKDDKTTVLWHLGAGSKSNFIYGMTKEEAISRFTDAPESELTEADYQEWLKNKK
jgi:hypothetical protein